MGNDDKDEMLHPKGTSCGARSTQKIGPKTKLTAAIGFEYQGSANEGLWRETA